MGSKPWQIPVIKPNRQRTWAMSGTLPVQHYMAAVSLAWQIASIGFESSVRPCEHWSSLQQSVMCARSCRCQDLFSFVVDDQHAGTGGFASLS
eukprot:3059903-Amphidinium_carterae.1